VRAQVKNTLFVKRREEMIILIRLEDATSAKEAKDVLDRTANFRPIRTIHHNGFSYVETEVPDKTILCDFLRSLRISCQGVSGILVTGATEAITHEP
jgi:hypothetical protein